RPSEANGMEAPKVGAMGRRAPAFPARDTRRGTARRRLPSLGPCLITRSSLKPPATAAENRANPPPILVPTRRWRLVIAFPSFRKGTRPEGRTPRFWPRARRLSAWLVAGLCSATVALAAAAPPDVNQAKANMLFNIAKFVEWPGLSPDKSTPLVFTILGEDELAAELAGLLSTKTVNGRPVFVRFARRAQDAKGSQTLYLAAGES